MKWVDKFKENLREKGADPGVIVTNAKSGIRQKPKIDKIEGIWFATFRSLKTWRMFSGML